MAFDITDLADKLRSHLEDKVSEYILVPSVSTEYMIRFANNEITVFNRFDDLRVAIYISKSRRCRCFACRTLDLDKLKSVIDDEVKRLEAMPEDPLYAELRHVKRGITRLAKNFDERVLKSQDLMVERLKSSIDLVRRRGYRCAGVVTFGAYEKHYFDSTGVELHERLTGVNYTVRVFYTSDITSMSCACSTSMDIDVDRITSDAVEELDMVRGLQIERAEPGRYRVLLSPIAAVSLFSEIVIHWLSAYNVISGLSKLTANDLNKKIASADLNVVDLSAADGVYGSEEFDHEGNATMNLDIIRDGVLRSYLHNNRTASRTGVESTGHAVGLSGLLMPSPRHVMIRPGDLPSSLDDLFHELKSGIYVQSNWYTRFQNVREGMFSTVTRDVVLRVVNGRPVSLLRGARISDKFDTLLNNYLGSSRRQNTVYWWDMSVPGTSGYVIVDGVNITTQ